MPLKDEIVGRRKRRILSSDWLLLVEGKDEVNLISSLIRHCLGPESNIQVIPAGGKDKFPGSLQAIRSGAQTRPTFQSIGVVRDADDNPDGAFKSVCYHLREVGYEPSALHGDFSDATPSVGVFIVPDGVECGALETICRRSVEDTEASHCVDQYLECLEEREAIQSSNLDKSFAHAYLAAMNNPMARVGEGACMGVWNFASPAFQGLSSFVRDLSSQRR